MTPANQSAAANLEGSGVRSARPAGRFKTFALRAVELILFCVAFAMIVPPVPSVAGQIYRLAPALIIGGVAFAGSLLLGYRRGAENPVTIALKLVFYIGLAWVVHQRVFHS
jgi:hypothetical protein